MKPLKPFPNDLTNIKRYIELNKFYIPNEEYSNCWVEMQPNWKNRSERKWQEFTESARQESRLSTREM